MDTNPETEVAGDAAVEAQLEALFTKKSAPVEEPEKREPKAEEAEAEEVDTDQPEAEEEPADEWEDVDLDGEPLKVPKTQAEKLKQALSERLMQADYTRKTQEVAERKRAIELQEQRVQLMAQAQGILGQKQAEIIAAAQQLQQYEQVNWSQLTAEEAYPLIVKRDQLRADIGNKQAELQRAAHEFQQRQEATETEWKQKLTELGNARLNEELGGWTEDKQRDTAARLKSLGYQEQELQSLLVYDPRFMRMAWESAQYRKLQDTKAQTIEKKVSAAKPFVPPASRGVQKSQADSKAQDLRERMRKTGKSEDVESFLAARFAAKQRR